MEQKKQAESGRAPARRKVAMGSAISANTQVNKWSKSDVVLVDFINCGGPGSGRHGWIDGRHCGLDGVERGIHGGQVV